METIQQFIFLRSPTRTIYTIFTNSNIERFNAKLLTYLTVLKTFLFARMHSLILMNTVLYKIMIEKKSKNPFILQHDVSFIDVIENNLLLHNVRKEDIRVQSSF